MNFPRIFVTTAAAISMVAAIGCSSTRTTPDTATAPMVMPVAPPEPIAAADTMPSHPALENSAPVIVANDSTMNTAATDFTERAPQADRN